MSEKGYRVRSVIICDDARQEINGKEILIGVYNDSIIFNQFPARWPRLLFRISISVSRKDFQFMKAAIIDEDNKALFSTTQPLHFDQVNTDDPILLGFAAHNLRFPKPEKYRVMFGLDCEPEEVSDFGVRAFEIAKEAMPQN